MTNKIHVATSIFFVIFVFINYLGFAFNAVDFNFANWEDSQRQLLTFIVLFVFSACLTFDFFKTVENIFYD